MGGGLVQHRERGEVHVGSQVSQGLQLTTCSAHTTTTVEHFSVVYVNSEDGQADSMSTGWSLMYTSHALESTQPSQGPGLLSCHQR